MSADKESSGVKPPPFDPADLLGKLEGVVAQHRDPTGGGKSWVSTIIIIVVALAGVAVWSWFSSRRNRELAKLRHEKNKAAILAEKAELDAHVARSATEIAAADREIEKAEDRIRIIEADIKAGEGRYEADLRAIDRIRSWRDVNPGPS
jgi:uncharacterized protein HemX